VPSHDRKTYSNLHPHKKNFHFSQNLKMDYLFSFNAQSKSADWLFASAGLSDFNDRSKK